jgi:hypothetical protein
MLRIPRFLHNRLTDGGVNRLEAESIPKVIVRLERSDKLKKSNALIGKRSLDLPACSTVLCENITGRNLEMIHQLSINLALSKYNIPTIKVPICVII